LKTIGLIGGMSWESTATYYRIINKHIFEHLGGLNSAKIILYSFNFDQISRLQKAGKWKEAGQELARAGKNLEQAGADFLVIATNTMHKVAEAVENAVAIPLLHIADPTAEALHNKGISKVGLIGTAFTMEDDFYRRRLIQNRELEVLIPCEEDRQLVHDIIFDQLCQGQVLEQSRSQYQQVIESLAGQGAQAVILGCTEISMLIGPGQAVIPLFDTTAIHAHRAAEMSLQER
jgi:aspartate racemase